MLSELKADIDAAFTGQLRAGVLHHALPSVPDGAGGTIGGGTEDHAFEGVRGSFGTIAHGIGGVPRENSKIEILASSCAVVPARLDTLTIEGITLQIVDVQRDPAAAWYECNCQSMPS
jgi:hypothetical protein